MTGYKAEEVTLCPDCPFSLHSLLPCRYQGKGNILRLKQPGQEANELPLSVADDMITWSFILILSQNFLAFYLDAEITWSLPVNML